MERESRILEYKRELPSLKKIAQTVVAFANGSGGQVVIGVHDKNRSVIGLAPAEIDRLLEKLPMSLADQIQPTLFPQVFEKTIEGKEVLIIQVFPGGQKPYFIASEGIGRGVYIRVGSHTRRAEGELLEELRLQRHRLSYDEALVLTCSSKELILKILPSSLRSQKALLSMDLIKNDPFTGDIHPTRGGILMLHPHPEKYVPEAYTILSRMRGNSGRNTIESLEIKGHLSQQSDSIYDVLTRWLSKNPRIVKTRYVGQKPTLPMEVVREAVNNALFHRQYSIAGPIKIALYSDRLEIFSPGHFAGPFIPSSLGDGTSYIRNKVICFTARHLNLIEKRGTGIRLIMEIMSSAKLPDPIFEEGPNWFKVTLFNIKNNSSANDPASYDEIILELFEEKSLISSADVCGILGVSKATAVGYLGKLKLKGLIQTIGKGPKTRYKISSM